MTIRPLGILVIASGIIAAAPASADHGHRRGPYARVVAVEPIVRQVVVERPRDVCRIDTGYRSARPGRVAASTLAGGVIGGTIGQAVGNNLGSSGTRAMLGLVGAAAGSAIANDRARRRHGEVAVPVETCVVTVDRHTEQHVSGYLVTYRYRGRLHRVRTLEHPGERILIVAGPQAVRYY
jgi:uncharacterized protein YcfJ